MSFYLITSRLINMLKLLKSLFLGSLFAISSIAVASQGNIIDVAKKSGQFKTLLTAIKVAKLTDTLKGKGPFTVFAPTDKAFAELPKATLNNLLQHPQELAKILTYHVIAGEVPSSDVKTGDVKTVNGQDIHFTVGQSGVMVNNAKVVKADIKASNGIIHVINKVLVPTNK